MKNEAKNIAKSISLLNPGSAVLVFEKSKDYAQLISSFGIKILDEISINALKKVLLSNKQPTVNEIKKSSVVKNLNNSLGLKSVYPKRIVYDAQTFIQILALSEKPLQNRTDFNLRITALIKTTPFFSTSNKSAKEIESPKAIYETINAPLLITDDKEEYIFASNSLINLLEIKKSELSYLFFKSSAFFDKTNYKIEYQDLPFIKALKAKHKLSSSLIHYRTKSGKDIWLEIKTYPIQSDENAQLVSFFNDVTENYLYDQTLLETLGNIQPVLYAATPDLSSFIFISEAIRNLCGYSPKEAYENKHVITRAIVKNDLEDYNHFIEKLLRGEEAVVEYKIQDRYGKERWIKHAGIPIQKNGAVNKIVGTIFEITDEKNTRLMLEHSEEKFRMLVDTADDLIFILNEFGYFSVVNKNGASALGYTPEEMIGKHFLEFIEKNEEANTADAFNKILSSNSITVFETSFLDRLDRPVSFEINARPLVKDNFVAGMLGIGRNTTERLNSEQKISELNYKLIEANRIISIEKDRANHKINMIEELNKLKSEFISNISHELRTPLASIVGFAETISSDPDLPKETVQEFSEIIHGEGKRLAKLINDVLDFSKLESGEEELKFESTNLLNIIDNVVLSFAKQISEKGLTLSKDFPEKQVVLEGDENRLTQVFYNLLSNAIKFTSSSGRVSILVNEYNKEVEIAVNDTGIGISEKDLQKLFQKFSKIQRPGAPIAGTGFGLVVVKQIIDLHKGFIKVNSQVNKGTTFIIRLPKKQLSRG